MWLPAASRIAERRRFWRARLAGSSRVKLQARGATNGPVRAACDGRLLNISPDGLACLLSAAEARLLAVGATVEACFELPGVDEPFTLTGRVRAKTPGAADDAYVLGVQFTVGDEECNSAAGGHGAHRRRLAEVLSERGTGV